MWADAGTAAAASDELLSYKDFIVFLSGLSGFDPSPSSVTQMLLIVKNQKQQIKKNNNNNLFLSSGMITTFFLFVWTKLL